MILSAPKRLDLVLFYHFRMIETCHVCHQPVLNPPLTSRDFMFSPGKIENELENTAEKCASYSDKKRCFPARCNPMLNGTG
jgi:hypothetical protein